MLFLFGGKMIRIQKICTPENKTRYVLVDESGELIEPVRKFLVYKDDAGRARNTLRAYCFCLCSYFNFLQQKRMSYLDVGIDEIAEFMRWLQTPAYSGGIRPKNLVTFGQRFR
jgi:integrase/recombinase XerD